MINRVCVIAFVVTMTTACVGYANSHTLVKEKNTFVKVPAGELTPFWLSTQVGKNGVVTKLAVSNFEAMVHQVTREEFFKFLKENPRFQKENISSLFADESYLENHETDQSAPMTPMTSVSWFAAKAYCESVGARLPTTIEWEYMAAASEDSRNASGDQKFLNRILEWYGEPKGAKLKPVQSIYKNIYGLWDLHGLVWEWVSDFNSSFVTGESREDSSFNRDMFCGAGSLNSGNKENYAAFMRFAFRSSLMGKSSVWNLGFRCVRSK